MADSVATYFVHAVGFTGQTLQPLADHVSGRTYTIDVVGHGTAQVSEDYDFSWRAAGEHLIADVERRADGSSHRIGFGHSGGGTALLWAEVLAPGTFDALFLYEPPVRGVVPLRPQPEEPTFADTVARRRNSFASRGDFETYLRQRKPFQQFSEAALAAYVASGLTPVDGRFALACSPELEAKMYRDHDETLADLLAEIGTEVVIARGEHTFERFTTLCAALEGRIPRSRAVTVPGLTHYGPLEDPALVAQVMQHEVIDRVMALEHTRCAT